MKKNEENPSITLKYPNNTSLHLEPSIPSKSNQIKTFLAVTESWSLWLDTNLNTDDIIQNGVKQLLDISEKICSFEVVTANNRSKFLLQNLPDTKLYSEVENNVSLLTKSGVGDLSHLGNWLLSFLKTTENDGSKVTNTSKQSKVKRDEDNQISETVSMVTMLFLLWPYRASDEESCRSKLQKHTEEDLRLFPQTVVSTAHEQIRSTMTALTHIGHVAAYKKEELYFD